MQGGAAVASIRSAAIHHNLKRVQAAAPGCPVLAVVKANAYGHGLLAVAQALANADALAVARLDAAATLRAAGVDQRIVVLSDVLDAASVQRARSLALDLVVYDLQQIEILAAESAGMPIHVWLKIDSGMGRLGIRPEDTAAAIERLQQLSQATDKLTLMTHLSCADNLSDGATTDQLKRFGDAIGSWSGDVSIANSAGILSWPDAVRADFVPQGRNWVRPGLMLYGISPLPGQSCQDLDLKPAMRFSGTVLTLRDLDTDMPVGYGADWRARRPSRIAIVNTGYADGYPWRLSDRGSVYLRGQRVPVVGRVSMDMLAIDATDAPQAAVGDDVELWGEHIYVNELAELAGTSPYELVTGIGARVRRVAE